MSSAARWLLLAASTTYLAATSQVLDLKRPDAGGAVSVITSIDGGEPVEWGGTRLAGGDINGDGIADIVIAAPGGTDDRPSRRGRLYVKFGSVAPFGLTLDRTLHRLRTPAGAPAAFSSGVDLVIDGWDDFDHLGRALAVADIDADGFADIIVGAPRADGPGNARPDCGEVYVVHGASTLPKVIELSAGPSPGVRLNVIMGRAPGDVFGSSLEVADVNGDGSPDIIAGAPQDTGTVGAPGTVNVGEVFIISGGAGLPALVDLAAPPPNAVISLLRGADPGDQAGSAVATGDFDGDSVADIAVGARGGDGPGNKRPDAGEVYLVFGARLLPPVILLGMQASAFIAPADIGDGGGGSLAMGDVNGDGRADLAIGAESGDGAKNRLLDAGDVWLLEGRTRERIEALRPPDPTGLHPSRPAGGPVLIDLASAATPGVTTISGNDPGDHTGIKAIVDLDQDGYADLVIGAEDSSSRRNTRAGGGEIRIIRGARVLSASISLDDSTNMTIYGSVGGGHLGKAVVAIDINGDNRPELLVSAPQAGQSLSGRIWVFGGSWKDLFGRAAASK